MNTNTKSQIDVVKDLYKNVGRKVDYMTALADHMGLSPLTLNNHWFCRFWSIPDDKIEEVIVFTIAYNAKIKNPSKASA